MPQNHEQESFLDVHSCHAKRSLPSPVFPQDHLRNELILIVVQVLNYEVVLASGEIVSANAKENSDLWVALRGGGNNFGVVTRFDFRTFKQGNVWGGSLYYFGDGFPGQLEALADELNKPDASKETHLMVSMGYAAMFGPNIMCLNR